MDSSDSATKSVSVKRAAQMLGVNEQTIRRWIWRGRIPAVRLQYSQGFHWRVLIDQVPANLADELDALDEDREIQESAAYSNDGSEDVGEILAEGLSRRRRKLAMAEADLIVANQAVSNLRDGIDSLKQQLHLSKLAE